MRGFCDFGLHWVDVAARDQARCQIALTSKLGGRDAGLGPDAWIRFSWRSNSTLASGVATGAEATLNGAFPTAPPRSPCPHGSRRGGHRVPGTSPHPPRAPGAPGRVARRRVAPQRTEAANEQPAAVGAVHQPVREGELLRLRIHHEGEALLRVEQQAAGGGRDAVEPVEGRRPDGRRTSSFGNGT